MILYNISILKYFHNNSIYTLDTSAARRNRKRRLQRERERLRRENEDPTPSQRKRFNKKRRIQTEGNNIFDTGCVKCDCTHSVNFNNRFYAPVSKNIVRYTCERLLYTRVIVKPPTRTRINTFSFVSKNTMKIFRKD